ncbi:MAG: amino acid permease [Limosilactobacillus sp.]|nr:amino acid permease [Limosilactobacillus sp.]
MSEQQQPQEMARNLKNRHVQLIALGGTIGTGLFLGAGDSIHKAGPAILLAYLITGAMSFLMMRSLGAMLVSNPNYRSFVEAVHDYLGPRAGFVTGWMYWLCWIGVAMAEVTAVGKYMQLWFPHLPLWVPGLIMMVIIIGLNLVTVSAFGETEFWFAMIKVVAITALILVGVFLILIGYHAPHGTVSVMNLVNHGGFFPTGWHGFMRSFQMVVFAFAGVEMIGMTAAETQDPKKVIPRAINGIPVRILLFYFGALFVIMAIYPWNQIDPTQSPFVVVFKQIGIVGAASIVNFVVITAASSSCNSAVYTTGRMLAQLTSSSSRPAIRRLGRLSKNQVPAIGVLISSLVIASATILNYVLPSTVFTLITSMTTTAFLFVWLMIVLAHLKFIKTDTKREFPLPGAPITDYLYIAFLIFIVVVLFENPSTLVTLHLAVAVIIVLSLVSLAIRPTRD